ncbi:acyltransferase [Chitinophaga sp. HK235]|uniref:acyltransferase family protein n=1 Tax=Chitinophaga sp. HK235 TaxID=2952571 RepID=UPI001BACF173|nr:acyltransferase [Chitinophaga sp. HK235]
MAWIDYARGIAIILVLYRHIFEGISRTGTSTTEYAWLENANIVFYSFRMPLFFILSGVFISRSLAKRTVGKILFNKVSTLLYPYLLWSVLQISLQICLSRYVNADRSLADYGYIFLFPRRIDQFWYLYALFNVSVLYVFTRQLLKMPIWQQLTAGAVLYILSSYVSIKHIDLGFVYDIMHYYIFFALGDLLSSRILDKENFRQYASWKTFGWLLPFFMAGQYYFLTKDLQMNDNMYVETYQPILFALIALTGCAFMYNISFILQRYNTIKWLRIVGYHSLYIYVSHVLVASATRMVLMKGFGITSVPLLLVICLVMAVVVPIIIYNLAIRAGAWWLYSLERPAVGKEKLQVQQS